MEIEIHRIYTKTGHDAYRVLVDRLWPRGISKADAGLDDWWKEIAPSEDLRKWFDHDKDRWGEFRKKYLHELSRNKEKVKDKLREVDADKLVLLYGAKNENHNNARVLKEYLERIKID